MAGSTPILNDAERACLAAIARVSTLDCCDAVVHRLISLGMVEIVTDLWLPLEKQHKSLRLTAAGRKVLESSRN